MAIETKNGFSGKLEEQSYGGCTLRVRKARQRRLNAKPSVCLERAKFMTEVFIKTEGEPLVIRKAQAFKEFCERGTIFIQDDELIIGNQACKLRAGSLGPDDNHSVLSDNLDTISSRPQDPFIFRDDQKRLVKEFIEPYWRGKSYWDIWKARLPEDLRQLSAALTFQITARTEGPPGVFVPDYARIIRLGVNGIREQIQRKLASLDDAAPGDYEKITYLNALLIVCDGMEARSRRYSHLAGEMAAREKVPERKAELEKVAGICAQVPMNPARNFWEALQSLWFYQVFLYMERNGTTYSLGRMDQYLYPYYQRDIESESLTQDQAQELLECLWVKCSEMVWLLDAGWVKSVPGYVAIQNVCCGGVTADGRDATNALSYMMLQATMDLRLTQPQLAVKYYRGKNPDSFLRKAAELTALGTGHPPFFNDEVGISHMLDDGIPLGEAQDWAPAGCMEPRLMGKVGNLGGGLSQVNMASAVELALLNGVHRRTETRLPVPRTGDPGTFETFRDFKDAVKTQLAYIIKRAVEAALINESLQCEIRPLLLISLGCEECVEKAKDLNCGGAKYNPGSELISGGIADICNSLVSVKKLIYDDKKLTWNQLLQALDNNFEGHENIREMCLAAPKYGNDNPEVDLMVKEISGFVAREIRSYKGPFGGKRLPMSYAAASHLAPGAHTGALPSGRRAWLPLADGISPMQGTDKRGPTAVLKSVSNFRTDLYTGSTLLNIKLDPSIFKNERGMRDFMSFIKSWADLGIYMVQFNVVSPETLKEAQREPEKHRDLMVRVSGYSAFFVELNKEIQDDIISRTTMNAT